MENGGLIDLSASGDSGGNGDDQNLLPADVGINSTETSTALQGCAQMKEVLSEINAENGSIDTQDGDGVSSLERDEGPVKPHVRDDDDNSISGVKRARVTVDEQQPSVRVVYTSLSRESKQKLGELLQQWSEWHAQHCSLSHDPNQVLKSGEETYFPALRVGQDKPSAVSFWMDNQQRVQQTEEFTQLDSSSVPLYDRGYTLGLTSADSSSAVERHLEIADASRCFNCGSYSHSLKECSKPRDNIAVNTARKKHKSRRSQIASSRSLTRYYQKSPGGKYDGLKPGDLDAETLQLLGLRELDPPPWLNRMREIGYPPGYLDPEDEDQPSGITLLAEGEFKEGGEKGEILESGDHLLPKKMSVEFPGINAPIPENADEKRWAAGCSSSNLSRSQACRSQKYLSESISRNHYHERRWSWDLRDEGPPVCELGFSPSLSGYSLRYENLSESIRRDHHHKERWSRDFRDEGPPGCEPGFSPSLFGYSQRYHGYDSYHTPYSRRDLHHGEMWSRDLRDEGPPGCEPGFSPSLAGYPQRPDCLSESISTNRDNYHEERWSKNFRDVGPPGCDPDFSLSSRLLSGYDGLDPYHISISRSTSYGRFLSDIDARSPWAHEGSSDNVPYGSALYSPSSRPFAVYNYSSFDYG